MGRYDSTRNQFVPGEDVTLFPAAARGATVNGSAVPCTEFNDADLTLTVTAASGTLPTLDVTVETRFYGGTWIAIGTAFAQKVAAGVDRLMFGGLRDEVRGVATIGGTGTPSVTFSLAGHLK